MAVLALDLAAQCGWALYENGMERPFFGSKRLKRPLGTNGEQIENLRKLMADQHAIHNFTDIVFEAQHIAGNVDPQTVYSLIGMGAMCEWFAHRIGARSFCVDIGTWRKHMLGRGSFKQQPGGPTARAQAKQRSMDACNARGWYPSDDNAADALGVLDYYLSLAPIAKLYPVPWRDAVIMQGARY
jgi:hypothetical protein